MYVDCLPVGKEKRGNFYPLSPVLHQSRVLQNCNYPIYVSTERVSTWLEKTRGQEAAANETNLDMPSCICLK